MNRLINSNGEVMSSDPWHELQISSDPDTSSGIGEINIPKDKTDYLLVSIDDWERINESHPRLFETYSNIGLRLSGEITMSELLEKLGPQGQLQNPFSKFTLLQVDIPQLKDGRCFSLAVRIRNQCNYTGELRAAGSYMLDQIYFMQRCGFNSFLIDTDMEEGILQKILKPFSKVYQRSGDDSFPITEKKLKDQA